MDTIKTQLLIVGSGPGGYVCAIRAGQLCLKTVIVEAEKLGGTCLNVGCIPSKALIHAADEFHKLTSYCKEPGGSTSMGIAASSASINLDATVSWKNSIVNRLNMGVGGLLNKANVQVVNGTARFRDGKTVIVNRADGEVQIQCENVVIATGSESIEVPSLPFSKHVLSSTDILTLNEVPKTLAVVGGGYIGLELGTCFAKLGSKVTVIESAERLLPQYDQALTQPGVDRLKGLGVTVLTKTKANRYSDEDALLEIEGNDLENENVAADKVLVTVGRRAKLTGWGLTELSLTTENNALSINDQCQTSMRGVYAIGDVCGEPMLAHRAMAQGDMVARILSGQSMAWEKQCIPAVCFTDPEIITAGLSPDEAEAAGEVYEVSTFPFRANGRAMSLQREDGFIRVVMQKESNVILGLQAVGTGVSELSAAFSIAIEMGARADDIAATIHAHPTLSEGLQEACLASLGYGLHF